MKKRNLKQIGILPMLITTMLVVTVAILSDGKPKPGGGVYDDPFSKTSPYYRLLPSFNY